jgi:hypothetical protein
MFRLPELRRCFRRIRSGGPFSVRDFYQSNPDGVSLRLMNVREISWTRPLDARTVRQFCDAPKSNSVAASVLLPTHWRLFCFVVVGTSQDEPSALSGASSGKLILGTPAKCELKSGGFRASLPSTKFHLASRGNNLGLSLGGEVERGDIFGGVRFDLACAAL